MIPDPIVDALHRQRAEEMERLRFDLEEYCRHLKEREMAFKALALPPPDSPPNPVVQRARAARR